MISTREIRKLVVKRNGRCVVSPHHIACEAHGVSRMTISRHTEMKCDVCEGMFSEKEISELEKNAYGNAISNYALLDIMIARMMRNMTKAASSERRKSNV